MAESSKAEVGESTKRESDTQGALHHEKGLVTHDREGVPTLFLPETSWHERGEDIDDEFKKVPFEVPPQWVSKTLALRMLEDFRRRGDTSKVTVGFEMEGSMYKKGRLLGRKLRRLRHVHDDKVVTHNEELAEDSNGAIEYIPPELHKAQFELVSGVADSVMGVKDAMVEMLGKGYGLAKKRRGDIVFESVVEGADASQIEDTEHPKVQGSIKRKQGSFNERAPEEVQRLIDKVKGLRKRDRAITNGTHVHSVNLEIPDELRATYAENIDPEYRKKMRKKEEKGEIEMYEPEKVYDARGAHVMAQLGFTQMAEVESLMLFNTTSLLSQPLEKTRDVRAYIRKAMIGGFRSVLPETAEKMLGETLDAVATGATHDVDRHPLTGQHDRFRFLKRSGTSESVIGASNPDLRLTMAHVYFQRLMRVMSYEALVAADGDETQALQKLKDQYGEDKAYLFTMIPTLDGDNSCYNQELAFHENGFDAKPVIGEDEAGNPLYGKTFREQIEDIREIVQRIGNTYDRAWGTEAAIVHEILGRIIETPQEGATLTEYMEPNRQMMGGIVADYDEGDPGLKTKKRIAKKIKAKAEGTRKQWEALGKVKTEEDLFRWFGMGQEKSQTPSQRKSSAPARRKNPTSLAA